MICNPDNPAQCTACRWNENWRHWANLPDVCPAGFTTETFTLEPVAPRRESIGEAITRLKNCEPCKKAALAAKEKSHAE